ncbi:MAG: FtsX-like permease family protein [Lachnospiraceae bacterium]|nr:FtsX-like permease family protein [Lachnospiraceae bacterium]MDE6980081.1 FtsX-like permease family protein [Lachnospiraceae bacterium]
MSFLQELKRSNLRQRKSLVFFITFAVFCFSAMIQMSIGMKELSSAMMAVMTILIGITLACVTLCIAITSVVKANGKTIAMMRVFGYNEKDCSEVVLGGYRPFAYLGFALGTGYQYALLRIAVTVVFANIANVPDYQFNVKEMAVTFVLFVVLYEFIMYYCTKKMKQMPLKEIMLD